VSSHIDWVNAQQRRGRARRRSRRPKAARGAEHHPDVRGGLTLTHIMSQKYIAQWGWAHVELWTDMRRYHYTDIDPATSLQVYPGFVPPATLYPDNGGKIVQRIRPRFNSEYVWNRAGLDAIGGLALDYHTKPMWITEP
jgi:hypothetical protein